MDSACNNTIYLFFAAKPVCSSDEFQCKESGQCVPSSWKCNSIIDCGDESDEDEKICGKPRTFKLLQTRNMYNLGGA